jgi:hypothetical protein
VGEERYDEQIRWMGREKDRKKERGDTKGIKERKKEITLPVIFGGSCRSNNITKKNSKFHHKILDPSTWHLEFMQVSSPLSLL